MPPRTSERTVYLREATPGGLEATLKELGAIKTGRNLDGSRWKCPVSEDVAIEVRILEDVESWQMELVAENLRIWRAPFAAQGWEPTIAAMLICDRTPNATKATSALAKSILKRHQGVVSEVWTE